MLLSHLAIKKPEVSERTDAKSSKMIKSVPHQVLAGLSGEVESLLFRSVLGAH